ncbi:ABC transporter permease [Nitrogeniibacter mangrovi]|uniref:ABC transporter permease n=1 Tax=Nitrogeniibacter mangrovi TaxID=2016596 RepID=A0A6C1B5L5_9RHOO|nr:ABC transporter permease [Nitrogeniibacter mangrovi]QID18733.1 ABC transporter permease [Nitrogeniibacter mangrovi]
MIVKLALRNVFRQKARTAMTLAAIVFGVAGLIIAGGFVQDVFIQLGEAVVHTQTGHVQVFRKGFFEHGTRRPEQYLIDDAGAIKQALAKLPHVQHVSARLNFSGLMNNGKRDFPIVGEGIEPKVEAKLSDYLKITAGRTLGDDDRFGMLVGQGVAEHLQLSPGDHVTLVINTAAGALNSLDFTVVGVFQSFSKDFDARAVRIPLQAAQTLMNTDGANVLVMVADDTEHTDAVLAATRAQLAGGPLEARSWRQLSDFFDKTVQLYDAQFGFLKFIILVMVILSVVNSVNMNVFERMSEFGTMRAIGTTPRNVFVLLVVENTLLGCGGALLGVLIGMLVALIVSAIGIPMPPPPNASLGYTAYIRLVPSTIAGAFLVGVLATVLAALLPARRAAHRPIVDALRQGT